MKPQSAAPRPTLSQRYRQLSLRQKLVILIAGVSLIAVSLSMLASFFIELDFFRSRLLEEYRGSARMISTNVEAAVEFEEAYDATDILSALEERENVVAAAIYLQDGRMLASYQRHAGPDATPPPELDAATGFKGEHLTVNEPVVNAGAEIGRVVLLANLAEVRSFLSSRAWSFFALLAASCLFATLLAARLGRRLSRPILELADTARRITEDHDFSTRQERRSDDETGRLVDAFNEMMAEIEKREDAILQAKERAEESSRAKDDFLSVISHELRTPLNPIIGYVEILLRKLRDDEDRKQLRLVKHYAEHLQSLIDSVIDYSRFERGALSLGNDRVDYRRLCQNVVGLLRPDAEKKSVALSCEHADCAPELEAQATVIVDQVKLQQIVLNLVSNAIKFTENGEIRIRTSIEPRESDQWLLRIEVVDTGIGIAERDREKVFKPFSQIDESLTRQYSGMGLGLAICKKIAQSMGGEIDFESEKWKGSTFWLELPVALSDMPEPAPEEEAPAPIDAGAGRVLLVDDQQVNLELGESMLASSGLEVVCARSGAEAIEIAKRERFNLIILDIKMPRMNGYQTAKELRKLENGRQHTPIVAMTAHVTTRGSEECFEAGMDDFLAKPFNTAKLNLILQKWLPADPKSGSPP